MRRQRAVGLESGCRRRLFRQFLLVRPALDVRAIQTFDLSLIEDRGPRADLSVRVAPCRAATVDTPAAPPRSSRPKMSQPANSEIVARQGDDVADFRRTVFGPFPVPHGAHLGERSDRFGEALANGQHAGNERGTDGAETDEQHAELAACGCDVNECGHGRKLYQLSAVGRQLSTLPRRAIS